MSAAEILIVEDNPLNLELATDLLESAGYRVRQAASAEEGIRSACHRPPQLILMDLSLPGMDGLAATRILRDQPGVRGIPIVALTAHAMAGDCERALEAGCDGYISKPLDTHSFRATVASFLSAA